MSVKFTTVENLIQLAAEARERSHCPYVEFPVGAALVSECGRVFTGCCIENACFPATICAERAAICKAVSEGYKSYSAVAVIG